jgi:hypothetical protein
MIVIERLCKFYTRAESEKIFIFNVARVATVKRLYGSANTA